MRPFSEATYSVAELTGEIKDVLQDAFDAVWVVGEVQRARASRPGHLYFELVEKGRGDAILGKLDGVIWRSDHARIRRQLAESGQEIRDGVELRCRGRVDFYGPGGRLQLVVRQVDPMFSLGLLEQRRRQTLAALERAGLMEKNREHALAELPLRLGLVTSHGSAAYHDFLSTLQESGYGFQLQFVHASVQGASAEKELISAVHALSRLKAGGQPLDALVLIRGGGSRSDLAVFDGRELAETVARAPLPVLTGLGHEIDQSITDLVSHTALKTPTKVAEYLVQKVAGAEDALDAFQEAICRRSLEKLRLAQEAVTTCERVAQTAGLRLAAASQRLENTARALDRISRRRVAEAARHRRELARRLLLAAPRRLDRQRSEPEVLAQRLVDLARSRLRLAGAVLEGKERLFRELSPERLLERGFSITRGTDGKVLQDPGSTRPGDRITTQLAGGTLESRVEQS